jgi:DNA-directed RNA polymerase subunit RPC12/RpoP
MHHKPPKPGTLAALALSGLSLYIQCGACKHYRRFIPVDALSMFGWGTTCGEIEARYRCSKCGKKKASIRYE